jgi:hypothetical protein
MDRAEVYEKIIILNHIDSIVYRIVLSKHKNTKFLKHSFKLYCLRQTNENCSTRYLN